MRVVFALRCVDVEDTDGAFAEIGLDLDGVAVDDFGDFVRADFNSEGGQT